MKCADITIDIGAVEHAAASSLQHERRERHMNSDRSRRLLRLSVIECSFAAIPMIDRAPSAAGRTPFGPT